MPTYEYLCRKCDRTFEVFQSMKDAPLEWCTCGKRGRVRRLIGRGAGIIFKGSGFYETDYKRPARTAEKDSAKPAGGSKGKEGSSKPSGSKKDGNAAQTAKGSS